MRLFRRENKRLKTSKTPKEFFEKLLCIFLFYISETRELLLSYGTFQREVTYFLMSIPREMFRILLCRLHKCNGTD